MKTIGFPCATLIIGLPGEEEEDLQLQLISSRRLSRIQKLNRTFVHGKEGGLKDKTTSFTIDKMTRKQGPSSFLECWEHNLDWSDSFLKEYFCTKGVKGME